MYMYCNSFWWKGGRCMVVTISDLSLKIGESAFFSDKGIRQERPALETCRACHFTRPTQLKKSSHLVVHFPPAPPTLKWHITKISLETYPLYSLVRLVYLWLNIICIPGQFDSKSWFWGGVVWLFWHPSILFYSTIINSFFRIKIMGFHMLHIVSVWMCILQQYWAWWNSQNYKIFHVYFFSEVSHYAGGSCTEHDLFIKAVLLRVTKPFCIRI